MPEPTLPDRDEEMGDAPGAMANTSVAAAAASHTVITAKVNETMDTAQDTVNNETARPSKWTQSVPIPELISHTRDIRRMVTEDRLSGEVGKIHPMSEYLKEIAKEFRAREKFGGSAALDHLINPSLEFSKEHELLALDALKPLFDAEVYNILAKPGALSGLAAGIRALSTTIHYADLRYIITYWAQNVSTGIYIEEDGFFSGPGILLEEGLKAARWFRPHKGSSYGIDDDEASNEDVEFMTLFLREHTRAMKLLSESFKTSTDKLRGQVGGSTTSLDLKGIMDRLLNTLDRDDLTRWGSEVVRFSHEQVLQLFTKSGKELDNFISKLEEELEQYEGDENENE